MTSAEMLNAMLGRYKNFISLTTPTTGKAAIKGLNTSQLSRAVFLTYSVQEDSYPRFSEISKIKISENAAEECFDIAFIDSWHTYESSMDALALIEPKMIDNSFIFVHDCFPSNLELISENFIPGPWCGVTFAAFRDFAISSGRDWVTVVDDYGLGILGPRNSQTKDSSTETIDGWQKKTMKEKISAYVEAPISIMRGVQSSDFLAIIEAMENRANISGYVNTHSTFTIPASNLVQQRDEAIQQRDHALQIVSDMQKSRSWKYTRFLRDLRMKKR